MKIPRILASSTMAGLIVVSPLSQGVTEHDNQVEFKSCSESQCPDTTPGPQVSSLVFYFDGNYYVTDGQPWDGVTINNITSQMGYPAYQADVYAGRQSSELPAKFFNDRSGGISVGPCGTYQSPLESLNFALSGILEIEGNDYPIVIGQNGVSGENCWYLGPNASGFKVIQWYRTSDDATYEYLLTPDGQYRMGVSAYAYVAPPYIFYVSKNQ